MKALLLISVVFSLMMSGQAVGQENADKQKAFAGHWALKMSNGAAGWMALDLTEGEWRGQLWTVGEPKAIKGLRYADGKLTFRRALRIELPDYPGGPYTGERGMRDREATAKGDDIKAMRKVPGGVPLVHLRERRARSPI